jgi:renalase
VTRVAVVGAGISGLACATQLAQSGRDVVLFDKGKRPGGRLSTLNLEDRSWDFGCQYLLPGDGAFAAQVADWRRSGLLAPWPDGPAGALVGVPGMSSLIEAQCARHDVQFGALVQRVERHGRDWFVLGPGLCEGPFAATVIAIPSEQTAPMLSLHDLDMAREAASARSRPCWTVMAAFVAPLTGVPAMLQGRGAIAWAARNNSKPGRGSAECWVIQAGPEWSQQHLECEQEEIATQLLALFAVEAGIALPALSFLKAHRWRFALSYGQHGATLWNTRLKLGACGDWCMAPQVEGAWRSGVAVADHVITALAGEPAERYYSAAR